MRIDTFKIEEWMNLYCPSAIYDLTSTCISPLSIRDLINLCKYDKPIDAFDTKLTYGEIHGSVRLKTAIKNLYSDKTIQNITITHGAIGANQLVFESLLEKGDEVLVVAPTYQQHYSLPKALGAKVNLVFLKEENRWQLNFKDLENSITTRTKLICLSNPNNPTGAVIPDETLKKLVEFAQNHNCWILCDEAYRGLNLIGNPYSASIADIYEKGISTGSMSKTYSLPGLRIGWVCAREDLINEINKHREYNTISISILDDYFAALALENKDIIAMRNFNIMKDGLKTLNDWLNGEVYVKAHLPQGGTTALLRYKKDVPSKILCRKLQEATGVAILPGETMEMEYTVRIGYCIDNNVLKTGLKEFSKFLRKF